MTDNNDKFTYYQRNRELILAKKKGYYKKNRDKLKEKRDNLPEEKRER